MSITAEELALDELEARLRGQGYTLIRSPSRQQMPAFLTQLDPDAIATGPRPNLVIEVVNPRSRYTAAKIRHLQAQLEGHDDWRLEVVYAPIDEPGIGKVETGAIRRSLESARRLSESEPQAAFLLACTAFESAVRNKALQAGRRQPELIRLQLNWLLEDGAYSQSEHMQLLSLWQKRNRLAHGDLDIVPTSSEIISMIEIAERLLS